MRAASLFSGIGAPECAMPRWDWLWHAEIEPFPSAVMRARHPRSVNLGDVNAKDFVERALAVGRPDVLVFGSPCQDFSVAGKRVGLDGARGNMALVGLRVARELGVRWLVFENVPGLLSSYSGSAEAERAVREGEVGGRADCDEDSDFAAFLSAVRECGYLGCYRIYDAQFAGVPQRRRRIFFVGNLGDWRGSAAVLFEPESLRGDPPPSRQTGERVTGTVEARARAGGGAWGTDFLSGGGMACSEDVAKALSARAQPSYRADSDNYVAFNNTGQGWWDGADSAQPVRSGDDAGGGGARESTLLIAAAGGKSRGAAGTPPGMIVADPITANEGSTYTHEGKHFRPHNLVFGGNNTSGAIDAAAAVRAKGGTGHGDFESENFVLAFDTTQITHPENRSRPDDRSPQLAAGAHPSAIAFPGRLSGTQYVSRDEDVAHALQASNPVAVAIPKAVTVSENSNGFAWEGDVAHTLQAKEEHGESNTFNGVLDPVAFQTRVARNGRGGAEAVVPALNGSDAGATSDMRPCLLSGAAVRRLTPRECERLQDFEDDYTLIRFRGKPAADGPRYRALGNSMAVCVVRSILTRLEKVDQLLRENEGARHGGQAEPEARKKKRAVRDRG